MADELPKEIKRELERYQNTNYDSLIKQIDAEYNIAWLHQFDKIQQALGRLKLYNNQKRDPDAVGEPLLFTVHQTILASLYDDELSVEFAGREEGDEETAENLIALAKFDYEKMGKDITDYMWDWDTLFFGRGLLLLMEFDRSEKFMCPIPEALDPMTFLRDPKAASVNGDIKGRGSMRFGGHELWLRRDLLKDEYGFFDTKGLRSNNEMKSLLVQAQQERDAAQNLQHLLNRDLEYNLGDNAIIGGLRWFTYWKGKKVMVVLADKRKRVIKYVELRDQSRYPIIDRPMYPHSHDWSGTSIPDIMEDKQRHKSALLNLSLQAMKADLYPMYLYDEDRIKNKGDLLNFAFNKFVGVHNNEGKDIGGAAKPLNKPTLRMDLVNYILDTLDASAQRATATPEMQQGQLSSEKRTLGELNLVASKVDTRYSLTAKVFGWSERDFWREWYSLYKEHFKAGIDEKIVRIAGSLGSKWRKLTKENIIGKVDPDVFIESKTVSEANRVRERILFQNFGGALLQDPTANKRFYLKKLARLNNLTKDEVQLLLPPTIEELNAEDENEELDKNKMREVHPFDDHMVHLEIHAKAAETAAKAAHIQAHKIAMTIKRNQPELFPVAPSAMGSEGALPTKEQGLGNAVTQAMKMTPSSAATPSIPTGRL